MASTPVDHLHSLVIMSLTLVVIYVPLMFGQSETQFTYNGFYGSALRVYGLASIRPNGSLQMKNSSTNHFSLAFHQQPISFKPDHLSFSTTFVFLINPTHDLGLIYGMHFIITPSVDHIQGSQYMGYPNDYSSDLPTKSTNHIFGIWLDTFHSSDNGDIEDNYVDINVNSPIPVAAASASYYSDAKGVKKTPLLLRSGKPIQIWIDYDEVEMLLNVTLAPLGHPRPSKCLLSKHINLSTILLRSMYVGFYSSIGSISYDTYILGWSWNQNGKAHDLDLSKLLSLTNKRNTKLIYYAVLIVVVVLLLLTIAGAVWYVRKKKYEEVYEQWEKEYAVQRFSYKDLYVATKGFSKSKLLGVGGFGEVYKGVLPCKSAQVAIKRLSQNSKQGIKEFVAEICSMKRLRHKNLVQLLGYCRRKEELLLVYDYLPSGSLDKYLFGKDEKTILSWPLRFNIVKGVASALLYLHEDLEQVVLHRDVKASNVLLDAEMNPRLGDFGLARLYDHDIDPDSTRVVGTMGYIAPEVTRTRRPTTKTDVFAFGMFLLEVGCGRRPFGKQADDDAEDIFLIDQVFDSWKRGEILQASDPKLEGHYLEQEMELILMLGLLCLHPKAEARPTMRRVVQFLNGGATLPDIQFEYDPETTSYYWQDWETPGSSQKASETGTTAVMSSTNSSLQYGR